MDINKWKQQIPKWFYKYRYPIAVVLVGIVLFMLPGREKVPEQTAAVSSSQNKPDISALLGQILGQIEGVGKVNVMLTVAESEKTLYQYDEDISTGENSSSVRQETIILTDGDRNQQALVSQVISPKYLGAVIVCQGADIPTVKWAVVEAVSRATGLGADQISVLKMK